MAAAQKLLLKHNLESRAHAHAQVTQILTPDQKAQLKALTETRRRR